MLMPTLVVWKCNGLKVPGRGEDREQLEERLRSIDFQTVQMLWELESVANFGLLPDEMPLVQVPATANDKGGDNMSTWRTCRFIIAALADGSAAWRC
jgi:hypothetical protein